MASRKLEITATTINNILSRTEDGFLKKVSSHSLQPYRGCTFGNALCGTGCYVQWLPYVTKGRAWGSFLEVRTNAAESYRQHYAAEKRWTRRQNTRFIIFCSSSTDPFLPQEFQYHITRSVLEAMLEAPPDRLILQTHTHRVTRYMDLYDALASRCELRFHVSIETDRAALPGLPPHASSVEQRLDACQQLRQAGHWTVVTVAPLLPIADPEPFFSRIAHVADAVVIDHFIEGDGTREGWRTHKTALPASMTLVDPASVALAYRHHIVECARRQMPGRVGVSIDGFAGHYE
jgi:DNA repair photolyase